MTRRSLWGGAIASACIGLGLLAAPLGAASASAGTRAATTSASISTSGAKTVPLQRLGTVNLENAYSGYAHAARPSSANTGSTTLGPRHSAPLGLLHHKSSTVTARTIVPRAATLDTFGGNVKGEHGFDGITAAINGGANSPDAGGIGDVTPPDQGLAAGPSPAGTVTVEFVNDTLNIYSLSGSTLLGALPAYDVFGLPPNAFLSDPRAYWDPQTGHWFLTMFTVGNSGGTINQGECSNGAAPPNCLSTQYIAVSTTKNPFGYYAIFSIDTSDSSNSANGCPCFGDYDMVGADGYGFYITTNEFPLNSGGPGFNGTVMYAMSKSGLVSAANGGAVPTVQRYVVPFAGTGADPYAGYHLSPSTITQGSREASTEYMVESNANLPNDATTSGLELWALLHTNLLNSGGRPTLVEKTIKSESYTELPPNALQKSGPTPLGTSVGFQGTAVLETDFNAVQEVTFANGNLYAELDTGFAYSTRENSGAAYFVIHPSPKNGVLSASMVRQGYVETSQFLLYPVIGVNASGVGFMAFTISGPARYPSAAYVTFSAASGAGSVVHIAANGAAPLDTFDCYPYFGFSSGQCRWGDYSMAQNYNGHIYMATEYIAAQPRDVLANWGTRVYWAPTSAG